MELGLHKSSYDYMRSSNKYLKNASVLKSIHKGLNDTKSQYGDIVKGNLTERRESTKGAIKFVLESKHKEIQKLLTAMDSKKSGKIDKDQFLRVLGTMGVFVTPNELEKYADNTKGVDYNSFIKAYTGAPTLA